jgi:hypothetical protein
VKRAAKTSASLTLEELQALFQEAILKHDDRVLGLLLDNSRTTRSTLFGVYQHGYVARLVEILGNDYEDLKAYLGDDVFDELARSYVSANPSRSQNARWFGSRMPEFLRQDDRYTSRPELSELAAIERALSNAFLTIEDLAAHKPEDWGRLKFAPHPSVTMLELNTNALDLWRAIKNQAGVPPVRMGLELRVVTWRQGTVPMIREMGAEEAMMWTEASRGVRFEALCEMVAAFDDPDGAALRAAGYLQGWLATEMLTSAEMTPRASAKRRMRVPQ